MFGSATTLVAESVPRHFRTAALGSMQALSACGNMLASALSLKITPGLENYWRHFSGWQVLAFVSVFPALMAIPMVLILREPEPWKKAKAQAAQGSGTKSLGSSGDLFRNPRWRKHLLVGVCLGVAGMVGLWGIAFFSPELITTAFKSRPLLEADVLKPVEICSALKTSADPAIQALKRHLSPEFIAKLSQLQDAKVVPAETLQELVQNLNRAMQAGDLYDATAFQSVTLKKGTKNLIQVVEKQHDPANLYFLNRQLVEQLFPGTIRELQATIDRTRSTGTFLQDIGALFGMFAFTLAAGFFSRRAAFMGAFTLCLVVVAYVFYSLKTATDIYWMLPLLGFATLSVFAGYSIYFPEIFPTRLRGTGVGFCYNTVRYVAAPFPLLLGWLSSWIPFRNVAVMMCGIYLVGIVALAWAPETKGQPLPEDS
jgi:MFS family permease